MTFSWTASKRTFLNSEAAVDEAVNGPSTGTVAPAQSAVTVAPVKYGSNAVTDWLSSVTARLLAKTAVSAEVRQLAVVADGASIPVVYGSDRLGALILNAVTSGQYVLFQCLWAYGASDIQNVRYNDLVLPGTFTVTHHVSGGADTEFNDAYLALMGSAYPDTLTGYSYSIIKMPIAEFTGSASFTALVVGRSVYDPRSGTAYSDNPAVCLADFLTNTVYGCGLTVDYSTVTTAANDCDSLVGGEKKRVLNGLTIIGETRVDDIAETLRAYAGCFLLPGVSGIKLVPDKAANSVMTYSHASGEISQIVSVEKKDLGNVPTVVEVMYTDASSIPWRDAPASAVSSGVDSTVPRRTSRVAMPGIQRYSQAYREAVERLNKFRTSDLIVVLDVFDKGIAHEEGDVITVTHPVGLSSKQLRVTASPEWIGNGVWRLTTAEYDPGAYSTTVQQGPTYPDTKPAMPPSTDANVAVNVEMTHETIAVYADADGTVPNLALATTTVGVFVEGVDDTANWTFNKADGPNGTTQLSGANNRTCTFIALAQNADSAYTDLYISKPNYSTITKRFTVVKQKAGATGPAGSTAKGIYIIASRQNFTYDSTGTLSPAGQTSVFSIAKQNTTATVSWSVTDSLGNALTPVTNYLSAATGDSVTMTAAQFAAGIGSSQGIIVTASITDGSTYTAKASVFKVRDGAQGPQGNTGNTGSPGADGTRGSQTFYVGGRTSWSDSAADSAITGSGLTKVTRDVVTEYGTGFSQTRYWSGSAWVQVSVALDGNLLVAGTVAAAALNVTSLSSISASLGTVTAGRLTITDNGVDTNYGWVASNGKWWNDGVNGWVLAKDTANGYSFLEFRGGTNRFFMSSWGECGINFGSNFSVSNTGVLTVSNAVVSGTVTASHYIQSSVNSAAIQARAVTDMSFGYTTTPVKFMWGSQNNGGTSINNPSGWVTITTCGTITCDSSTVVVINARIYSAGFIKYNLNSPVCEVAVLRDGSPWVITTDYMDSYFLPHEAYPGNHNYWSGGSPGPEAFPKVLTIADTPGPGDHTYSLAMRFSGSDGGSAGATFEFTRVTLQVTVLKR